MRRGTTPPFKFRLRGRNGLTVDTASLKDGRITFRQGNVNVVDKKLSECTLLDDTISVQLSQKETLRFDASIDVRIQGKFLDMKGNIIPTKPRTVKCSDIFNEEIL